MHPQTTDPRRAGQVRRYHTWPQVGGQQTNAEHGWQVARLLLAMWPQAPRYLVLEALFHDCGEMVSGDPPYPLKAHSPSLKVLLDEVERDARLAMARWGLPAPCQMTELERDMLKMADLAEMLEWALEQKNMGNQYAELVNSRIKKAISELFEKLKGTEHAERVVRYLQSRGDHEEAITKGVDAS